MQTVKLHCGVDNAPAGLWCVSEDVWVCCCDALSLLGKTAGH
ncbi:hypothetical protein [Hafnia paralvei]|nr:hypothetical protein [Hafnia paralvei]